MRHILVAFVALSACKDQDGKDTAADYSGPTLAHTPRAARREECGLVAAPPGVCETRAP